MDFFARFFLGVLTFTVFLACGRGGQLVPFPNLGQSLCRSDAECGLFEVCDPFEGCVSRLQSCDAEFPCAEGFQCSQGLCLQPGACYFSAQCPVGYGCEGFRCVSERCRSDQDCSEGRRCDLIDGLCRAELCLEDAACGAGTCCNPVTRNCAPKVVCERYDNGVPLDCQAVPERCDGEDNDCDAAIDEDFPDLGQVCWVGEGLCLRVGNRVCAEDGGAMICDVQPGSPVPEICDGADNDCDGETDENC